MFPRTTLLSGAVAPGVFVLCLILFAGFVPASAEAQLGTCGTAADYFQIDGQFYSSGTLVDWAPGGFGQGVFDAAGNTMLAPALYDRDEHWAGNAVDPDAFDGMGNKNNDDIGFGAEPWDWGPGSGPSKNDLTDVYAHSAMLNGDVWLFLGALTRATNGASHLDFEFNQEGFTLTGEGSGNVIGNGTDAGRTAGIDFISSVDFTSGGDVPVVSFRVWQQVGTGHEFVLVEPGVNDVFVCTNSQAVPAPPWGAISSSGDPTNTVEPFQLVEIALNLTGLGIDPSVFCSDVSTLLFKTRSAPSFTAELKDLALYNFSIFPVPDCTITADKNPLCEGETTSLCAPEAPAGADYSYLWTGPEEPYWDTPCISASMSGIYTLTITDNTTGCASSTCTFDLQVNSLPDCAITFDTDTVCAGASAEFCGPTPPQGMEYSYTWTGPGGQGYPDARCLTVSEEGIYTLVVTNVTTGCAGPSCQQLLTVTPLPPNTITGQSLICETAVAELCGPEGNYDYAWDGPGGPYENTQCIQTSAPGSYTLVVTDRGTGCSSEPGIHELLVAENPGCAIEGPASVCPDATVELCGPEGDLAYSWTGPEGFVSAARCINVGTPGLYTLNLTDGNGCETSCEHNLDLDENVSAGGLEDLWLCTGDRAEFCIDATGTGPLVYTWRKDGVIIPDASGACYGIPSIAAEDVAEYTVTVTGKCSEVTRGADLTLADVAVTALRDRFMCEGQEVVFCPEVTGRGPFSFEWRRDGVVVGTDSCYVIPFATESDEGEYCVTVRGFCGEPVIACATMLVGECVEYCGLTQGFYGNPGGKWNGLTTLELLDSLITPQDPLVLGIPGVRSVTFPEGSEKCIISYLPGGGRAAPLRADLGDAVVDTSICETEPRLQQARGRLKNILLAQAITLSLNTRLDPNLSDMPICELIIMIGVLPGPDGELGTEDDIPNNDDVRIVRIPESIFLALSQLQLEYTAGGLLELANRVLAEDLPLDVEVPLGDVAGALGSINDVVDECALTIHCEGPTRNLGGIDARKFIRDEQQASVQTRFGFTLMSPNPLRGSAGLRVSFQLPEDTNVRLAVYDISGRVVGDLVSRPFSAGAHEVELRGLHYATTGIYFIRVDTRGVATGETHRWSKKVLVLP